MAAIAFVGVTGNEQSGTVDFTLSVTPTPLTWIAIIRWGDYDADPGIIETLGGWTKILDVTGLTVSGRIQRLQVLWARQGAADARFVALGAAVTWQVLRYNNLTEVPGNTPIYPVTATVAPNATPTNTIPVASTKMNATQNWLLTAYTATSASNAITKDPVQTLRRGSVLVGLGVTITTADDIPNTTGQSGTRTGTNPPECVAPMSAQIVLVCEDSPPIKYDTGLFAIADMV